MRFIQHKFINGLYRIGNNQMIDEVVFKEICDDFFPVFRRLSATDVYSITLGGSYGKNMIDPHSDLDFRIYYEKTVEQGIKDRVHKEIERLMAKWNQKHIKVDGIFPRSYSEVDEQLDMWFSGKGKLIPYSWTVWGYCILTDIFNQQIIEDPYGRAADWKKKLSEYPTALKKAIIGQYGASLRYWKDDYHYQNKVKRKDIVFLASITSRLINDIVQAIYALNEFYYPGDGMNLVFTRQFDKKPAGFEERVANILRTPESGDAHEEQYKNLNELIGDVLSLINDMESL
jgi:hypothetical protein